MLLTIVALVATFLPVIFASPIAVSEGMVVRSNCPNGPFRCNGKHFEVCDGNEYKLMWDCDIPDNPMVTCSLAPIRGCARAKDLGWIMHSDDSGDWLGPYGATVNPLQTYPPTQVVQAGPQATNIFIDAFKKLGTILPFSEIEMEVQAQDVDIKPAEVTDEASYSDGYSNDVLYRRLLGWPKPSKTSTLTSSTTSPKTSTVSKSAITSAVQTTTTSMSSVAPRSSSPSPNYEYNAVLTPPHRTFFADPFGKLPTVQELEGFNRIVISGYKNGASFGHLAAMEANGDGLFWEYENAGIRVFPSIILDQSTAHLAGNFDGMLEYLNSATASRGRLQFIRGWHLDFEQGHENQMDPAIMCMSLKSTFVFTPARRFWSLSYAVSASYFHSHPTGHAGMSWHWNYDAIHIKFFGNGNAWTDCNTLVHDSTATGYTTTSLEEISRNTVNVTSDERGSQLALGKPINPNTAGYMDMTSLGRCFKQAHCGGIPSFSLWGSGDLSPKVALQEFNNGFNSVPCST